MGDKVIRFTCDICHKVKDGLPIVRNYGMTIGRLNICKDCDRK